MVLVIMVAIKIGAEETRQKMPTVPIEIMYRDAAYTIHSFLGIFK